MPKLEFSANSNLLEQSVTRYQLADVQDPEYFRHLFEYTSVPKIPFNHRTVPMNAPRDIWITDTTFRDGQQSMAPFTVKQIVDLFKLISRLGGPKGIVRQSEFFVYTDKDREAFDQCSALGLQFPEITTWIRADKRDFDLVKKLQIRETGILVSCSDYHIFKKMRVNRRQAMDQYLSVVKMALEYGISPRCHLEDITRADFYGFVVPFAEALMDLSRDSGIPVKIRACDTMGFGVPYTGVALPRSVAGIIYGLNHYARVPSEMLEWHGHNDFYKVVANAGVAWLYGCAAINCALMGIGERAGNCPLEAMAIEYASIRGTTDGMDLTAITDIARYFEKEIGMEIPLRMPFVGRNFNATRAGIHADGLLKDEEIYNIFDTKKILNRAPVVMIGPHSGTAGIAYWITGYYPGAKQANMNKRHPTVVRMKELIDEQYEQGRTTTMGDEELDAMLLQIDPQLHAQLTKESWAQQET